MSGIITGVIIAVITGTLIPFATTQWSAWSANKSAVRAVRQAALLARLEADEIPNAQQETHPTVLRLRSMFTIKDEAIANISDFTNSRPHVAILATWAAGKDWRARRAARAIMRPTSGKRSRK